MKTKILLFSLLLACGTVWAQTSYGNLQQGNAGDIGGDSNSFFGYQAGVDNGTGPILPTEGIGNTFIGYRSGYENTYGSDNTFLGSSSGYNNTSGFRNTFIGVSTGRNNTNGDFNTYLGWQSGYNNQTGLRNVFLGYAAGYNETGSDRLYIDNSSTSSPLIWGNFSLNRLNFNGNVGIGTETPSAPLHIVVTTAHDATPNVAGTQISQGRIELTRNGANPYIDFQNDQSGTDYDARILLSGNDDLSIYGARLNMQDNDINSVRELELRDYDDNTGGTDNKYRILARDGAFQFYNGGVVVGNYGNGTWTDLNDGRLIVEDRVGIGTTSPQADLHVNGTARITNVSQNDALTRILVEDADGDIFWRDVSSLGDQHDFPSYPESAGDGGDETNAYFGHEAGIANVTGIRNTFIGYQSGILNNSGYENSALGALTLTNNTTGAQNTANGIYTLNANSSGNYNSAIGYGALGFNTEGHRNTAIGYSALSTNLTGSNNTAVGNNAGTNGINYSNTTALGNGAIATASNRVRIGDATVTVIEGQVAYSFPSDARFKSNISENDVKGLDFIKRLRPVVYNFDTRKYQEFSTKNMPADIRQQYMHNDFSTSTAVRQSGFIAQEVVQAALESKYDFNGVHIPKDENDNYSLAYSQFVVPLTKAIQELSTLVEAQQQKIEQLENMIYGSGDTSISSEGEGVKAATPLSKGFALAQNVPNPFDKTTTISATIPETVRQAKIAIYNLNGLELQSYDLNKRGKVSVEISGGVLPSGMYLYALISDGQIIDTKKMILKK